MLEKERIDLASWGLNDFFADQLRILQDSGLRPGRVLRSIREQMTLMTEEGAKEATISGAFRYTAVSSSDYPTTGDWVLFRAHDDGIAIVERVLERSSSFSRNQAGRRTEEQLIATNVDLVCIVFGLNGGRNYSTGALQRYLTLAAGSRSTPVILLNKVDLTTEEHLERVLAEVGRAAPQVPCITVSAYDGFGLEALQALFTPGMTIAFVGPSGVGKSTLLNALARSELQRTASQRESDKKGRHTTTSRELFMLPSGVMIIDSPGMRELQLYADPERADEVFEDIAELATLCRYSDCSHQGEPGCAVQEALSSGELEHRRYEQYLELRRELEYLKTKVDQQKARESKKKWKDIAKLQKELKGIRKNR